MWKTTLKILFDKFLKKAQVWLKETGFTNIAYLGIAVALSMGVVPLFFLSVLKSYLIGASLGIFVYLNWNVITKLVKGGLKIQVVVDGKQKEMIVGDCWLRCPRCDSRVYNGKCSCTAGGGGDSGGPM
jgi:hypothetical protein